MENTPDRERGDESSSSEVSRILHNMTPDNSEAVERLFELVYQELQKLAGAKLANEHPDHTLQATELVHEAYVKMTGPNGEVLQFNDRRHFYATAARAMQRDPDAIKVCAGELRHRFFGRIPRVNVDTF